MSDSTNAPTITDAKKSGVRRSLAPEAADGASGEEGHGEDQGVRPAGSAMQPRIRL